VGAFGCSNKNPHAPASVHGSVTYNGKPVTGGTIAIFTPDKANRTPLVISNDGTYAGTDLPAGECVVTIETESIHRAMKTEQKNYGGAGRPDVSQDYAKKMAERGVQGASSGAPQKLEGVYVKIPSKYADAEKSPLRVTLKAGDQKQDFELAD